MSEELMTTISFEPADLLRAKLRRVIDAKEDAIEALASCLTGTYTAAPGEELVSRDQPYRGTYIILSGWASRSRDVYNGERQIINFLLAGDTVGYAANFFQVADHDVRAITPLNYAQLNSAALWEIATIHPKLFGAFIWGIAQEEAMMRDQIVGLGRLRATDRIRLLLADLVMRQTIAGVPYPKSHELPLNQQLVADSAGISVTHANRCIGELSRAGFVSIGHNRLRVLQEVTGPT
ncbi:MAG: Crp/Fnr family transcriptional regulator [Alphaproteobacteria bacterium]|jgi:CRP-like cAMP-binding protein|uniref:Crp/Fnr family transcriptional regulator n=1 Tax=Pacificispira sp. TaxID=2888761 RepID=UPI002E9F6BC4|nr:Crp/Fnr family transcriptional regulator [Pseudomonadota bacterium]